MWVRHVVFTHLSIVMMERRLGKPRQKAMENLKHWCGKVYSALSDAHASLRMTSG